MGTDLGEGLILTADFYTSSAFLLALQFLEADTGLMKHTVFYYIWGLFSPENAAQIPEQDIYETDNKELVETYTTFI